MKQPPRISLDAMGGDHAPEIVVKGADRALAAYPDISLIFVGDERKISPLLKKTRYICKRQISIIQMKLLRQKLSPLRLCAQERIHPCGKPLSLLLNERQMPLFLQVIQEL